MWKSDNVVYRYAKPKTFVSALRWLGEVLSNFRITHFAYKPAYSIVHPLHCRPIEDRISRKRQAKPEHVKNVLFMYRIPTVLCTTYTLSIIVAQRYAVRVFFYSSPSYIYIYVIYKDTVAKSVPIIDHNCGADSISSPTRLWAISSFTSVTYTLSLKYALVNNIIYFMYPYYCLIVYNYIIVRTYIYFSLYARTLARGFVNQ